VVCGADPGPMDGATLLQRVQQVHPEALRILALPAGIDPRLGERLARIRPCSRCFRPPTRPLPCGPPRAAC
jgi:hypothetical protein